MGWIYVHKRKLNSLFLLTHPKPEKTPKAVETILTRTLIFADIDANR